MLAQADVLLLQQPPGQTAHFPLGTYIGAGAYDDVHAMLLSQLTECADVVVTSKVVYTLLLFVDVPEDVDTDGVHTQRLAHLDAVFPVFAGDAGVVYFGGLHGEAVAVEQKLTVTNLEGAGLRLTASVEHRNRCQHKACQDSQKCFFHNVCVLLILDCKYSCFCKILCEDTNFN